MRIKQLKYSHNVDTMEIKICKFVHDKYFKDEMELTPQEFIATFGKKRMVVSGEKITYAVSDVAWDVVLYQRKVSKVILSRSIGKVKEEDFDGEVDASVVAC